MPVINGFYAGAGKRETFFFEAHWVNMTPKWPPMLILHSRRHNWASFESSWQELRQSSLSFLRESRADQHTNGRVVCSVYSAVCFVVNLTQFFFFLLLYIAGQSKQFSKWFHREINYFRFLLCLFFEGEKSFT